MVHRWFSVEQPVVTKHGRLTIREGRPLRNGWPMRLCYALLQQKAIWASNYMIISIIPRFCNLAESQCYMKVSAT